MELVALIAHVTGVSPTEVMQLTPWQIEVVAAALRGEDR